MLRSGAAIHPTGSTEAPTGGRHTRLMFAVGVVGASLLLASCGGDSSAAQPPDTIPDSRPDSSTTASTASTTASTAAPAQQTTTSQPPTTEAAPVTSQTTNPATNSTDDPVEGQDTPTIIDWALEVDSAECKVSDLPGSPGGEAVVPANWAAGNAEYVQFVVDGDLRPANMVRDVAGTGNIQVPCDPALNDGHEVIIVAYAGPPADPGDPVEGPRLIVTTTATVDNGQ